MARLRVSLKRTLLLSAVVAVSLFSAGVLSADDPRSTSTTGRVTSQSTTQRTTSQGRTTTQPTSTLTTSQTSSSTLDNPKSTSTDSATSASSSTTTGSTRSLPGLTSTSKLSLPPLPSTTNTGIPDYPPPTVPPTQNAPFMQQSNLPDGTVFIAVGGILGAFGVAIIVWRAVIACLLHRSIARAAVAQQAANDKALFVPPTAAFYKYADRDSSINVGAGGPGGGGGGSNPGRGVRRTSRGPVPSATPSQTNLFFSPTAPGAGGMGSAGNRDSRLLPSGFYAAGSASPAGPAHGHSISLSNMRPESVNQLRASPPESPPLGPTRPSHGGRNMSGSSLSLNQQAGRSPSTYLNDLLDDQPHLFPPGMGPSHNHSYSHSSQGGGRY